MQTGTSRSSTWNQAYSIEVKLDFLLWFLADFLETSMKLLRMNRVKSLGTFDKLKFRRKLIISWYVYPKLYISEGLSSSSTEIWGSIGGRWERFDVIELFGRWLLEIIFIESTIFLTGSISNTVHPPTCHIFHGQKTGDKSGEMWKIG